MHKKLTLPQISIETQKCHLKLNCLASTLITWNVSCYLLSWFPKKRECDYCWAFCGKCVAYFWLSKNTVNNRLPAWVTRVTTHTYWRKLTTGLLHEIAVSSPGHLNIANEARYFVTTRPVLCGLLIVAWTTNEPQDVWHRTSSTGRLAQDVWHRMSSTGRLAQDV